MSCTIEFTTVVSSSITLSNQFMLPETMVTSVNSCLEFGTVVTEAKAQFVPFFFTATEEGENVFTFSSTPISSSVVLCVEGIMQSVLNGDFSVSGRTLTVPDIETGDKVYGYYAF